MGSRDALHKFAVGLAGVGKAAMLEAVFQLTRKERLLVCWVVFALIAGYTVQYFRSAPSPETHQESGLFQTDADD